MGTVTLLVVHCSEVTMKLLVAVLLCLSISLSMAAPGCGGYGKRSPGPCRNRNSGSGGAVQGRTGRTSNLQDGLRNLRLNTLLSLIESAGLVEALSGDGQLTLFAPTDAALKTFIDSLPNAPDTATVKKVLLNHVIAGRVRAEDISDGLVAENLDGNDMTIRVNPRSRANPTGVTVGGARVAKTNIPVLSLTVHTLDDVINPFELGTLQEGLKGLGLTTLTTLLENADLVGALSGDSDLTLFAPTNKAIQSFLDSLPSAPDAETVKTVLLNHVISGKAESGDISNGLTVENLAGNDMTFRVTGRGVTIGGARVTRTDIPVLKVTVHIIDDVINPANLPGRRC